MRHIDGQKRKFNADWYKRFFSWIRYDVCTDSAFCGICRTFRTLRNHNNKTNFTNNGYSNWKNALEKFKNHEQTKSHQDIMILWINKNDLSKPTCAASVNSQHQKNVDLNR